MRTWCFELPFPPSLNGMWRSYAGRTILSKRGREYRKQVIEKLTTTLIGHETITSRVKVRLDLYPPCKRKRDIDNYPKSVFDALTHAGVWLDDEQVDEMRVVRKSKVKGGKIVIMIAEVI